MIVPLSRPLSVLSLSITVFLAACSSPETRREEIRAKIGPPQPPLQGEAAYFGGKIMAVVVFDAAHRPRPARDGESGADAVSGGERRRTRPFGGESPRGEGPRGAGGGMGGGFEGRGPGGPRPAGGGGLGQARQALTVTLKNTSDAPVSLTVTDVVSNLGNFVPVPEKATLAPGESVTLEPMRGALANLDEFDVKLGVRTGSTGELQTVHLTRAPSP